MEQASTENANLTITSPEDADLIIYHKKCYDGVTAYAVARLFFEGKKEIEGIACAHGDPVPDCTGRNVVILDFSFSKDVVEKMQKDAKAFILLDHHKSALENLKGVPGCIFDMKESGAMLSWRFFFPDKKAPKFVEYVQDGDLYKWELANSREFTASAGLMSYDPAIWTCALKNSDEYVSTMTQNGIPLIKYKNEIVERAAEGAELFTWTNFLGSGRIIRVAFVNVPYFVNEIGETLYSSGKCDLVLMYKYSILKKSYQFYVRTLIEDASLVAMKFGGGGHKGASGFFWNKTMDEFLFGNNISPIVVVADDTMSS